MKCDFCNEEKKSCRYYSSDYSDEIFCRDCLYEMDLEELFLQLFDICSSNLKVERKQLLDIFEESQLISEVEEDEE
ncbi:MAG: hypothetical protein R3Y63_08860 [Eubacteriales bacterium]